MKIKLLFSFLFLSYFANAQGVWNQKANFNNNFGRSDAVGFSIGSKGYIGTGYNGAPYQDFWEWDQATNVWTQKANFGGGYRQNAVGFSIGTKGYIGTGKDLSVFKQDFWEWDQATNVWSQKTNFAGGIRMYAVGFSIGTKGYIGTGYAGSNSYKKDFWEWDESTNVWTQKANFAGGTRSGAIGFSIGVKGYIGTGYDSVGIKKKDFWEWDQSTNTWIQKANFGGPPDYYAVGFSIGTKGYIGTGIDSIVGYTKDFWEWDQATDSWLQKANVPGGGRCNAVGFSIGGKGYIGIGYDGNARKIDYWEYDPNCTLISVSGSPATINCGGIDSLSVVFSPINNAVYSWTPSTGLNNTTISNPIATPGISTTYTVTVTDTVTQCSATGKYTVIVVQPQCVINSSPSNTICIGSSTSLTATYSPGSNDVIYSWSPTIGLNNPNISNPVASPTVTTTYTLIAQDTITNCGVTKYYTISVYPSVTFSGNNICSIGQNATLCASGGTTYLWSTGQTTSCIVVSPSATTTYTVDVTSSNGCSASMTPLVTLGGYGCLTQVYNDSACGLNFVNAYQLTETRTAQESPPFNINGTGLPTTLSISGLPNFCTILRAYVWYTASYQTPTPPSTTVDFTNTIPTTVIVPATIIGTGPHKCWNETGTVNYRADVTSLISGNGIYGIDIAGFTNPNWEVDGVDLFIIYQDNSATYRGSLIIWEGDTTTSTGNAISMTMTGINACATDTNAKAFILTSDRQESTMVGPNHYSILNGDTVMFQNDFWNWDEGKTTVISGQQISNFATLEQNSDCYDWAVMGLYYQTSTCTTCIPNAISTYFNNDMISISPNPTSGNFTIQSLEKISYIQITNILGEKIYSSQLNSNKSEIDLCKQPSGIYFLQLKSVHETTVKKIIVNR